MTEQLQLAPVHNNDPVESVEAAMKVDAEGQLRKVLFCLWNAERPLSDDEIADRCALLRNSAGTRRGIARNMHLVERVGSSVTPRGNRCATWQLTESGRRWVIEQLAGA